MKLLLSLLALISFSAAAVADTIAVKVVDAQGLPVQKADVVAILKSGAYQDAKLDKADGQHKCHPAEECVKIYAAAPGHEAASKRYSGNSGVTTIELKASDTKGSAVIRRSGRLPGIDGTVSPMLDELKRTYMYSTKIVLDQQPQNFVLNHSVSAKTAAGQRFKITVLEITGDVSLLEFTNPK